MNARAAVPLPTKRLLTRAEAAAYVGLSLTLFDRDCGVRPLDFGGIQHRRWDRLDLDAWIDRRKGSPEGRSTDEWLAGLDRGHNHAG